MSKAMRFIDDCLAGAATLDEIDSYVERWHEGAIGRDLELREVLGMTQLEYARWMQDADAINDIIAARKSKLNPAKS